MIGGSSSDRPSNTHIALNNLHNDTAFQLRQYLNNDDMKTPDNNNNNQVPILKRLDPISANNLDTLNSIDMQQTSVAGRSSIDIENLFKMKEEYVFVFSGTVKDKKRGASVEVFDVTRGIWREFELANTEG